MNWSYQCDFAKRSTDQVRADNLGMRIASHDAEVHTLDGKYVRYRALSTYGTATFKGTYRTGTVSYNFFFKF